MRGKEGDIRSISKSDSCVWLGLWGQMTKLYWAIVGHFEEAPQSEGNSVPAI